MVCLDSEEAGPSRDLTLSSRLACAALMSLHTAACICASLSDFQTGGGGGGDDDKMQGLSFAQRHSRRFLEARERLTT